METSDPSTNCQNLDRAAEGRRYTPEPVDSTLETLDGDRVKLTVAVDADEFEVAVDAAFRRIGHGLRFPGFRPGKAPRRVIEARIGLETGRQDALEHALPDYYGRALIHHEVDAIGRPEIKITGGVDTGRVSFDAVVPVRPRLSISDHRNLRLEVMSPEPSEDEVKAQVDALRSQLATLEKVERPATRGDLLTIDVEGTRHGEPVPGLTATEYLYEVGSGAVVPDFDDYLDGSSVGDYLEFDADHPDGDGQVSFSVSVKAVQVRLLPELDDEFAAEVSEFSTAKELVQDLHDRIGHAKRQQVGMLARDAAARAVADLVDVEVPEDLVESEIDDRIRDLDVRLQSQGLGLERYLEATGREVDEIREEFREAAQVAARVDLGLRAVAYVEYLDENEELLDSYLEAMAVQTQLDVEEVRVRLRDSGRLLDVRADVSKRAALEWLLESAEIVDEDGNSVDRALLEVHEPVIPEEVVAVDETSGVDFDKNDGTDRDDQALAGNEEEDA